MKTNGRIAIVGMAGRFPGTDGLPAFWDAVRNGRDLSSEVPPGRWVLPPERVRGEPGAPDRVSSTRGYYLTPFAPRLAGSRVDARLLGELDTLHQLAVDVGLAAWASAKTEAIDPDRVAVIIGNIALPTDRISDLARDVLGDRLGGRLERGHTHPLNRHVAGLPALLIAQALGLGGRTFALDAACASSLYSLKLACDELLEGRADAALAGGMSRPDCLYTSMGFSQLRALSPTGRCSPFDARADGLVVGEGAGLLVLKRLADAERDGDAIRGVICGAALSNDIDGNLLAPASEGQLRAMRAAYAAAGWSPDSVDLIECHATGTPRGDAVEFASLRELWRGSNARAGQCVIGSVKSTVGHLLTGANAAGLAKVLLAIENCILPPTANFENAAPTVDLARSPFRLPAAAEEWPAPGDRPRRAAVSGFGFGGINAHLLVEEYRPSRTAVSVTAPVAPSGDVAITGIGLRLAAAEDRSEAVAMLLGGAAPPVPEGGAFRFGELVADSAALRIPPRELAELLPQQVVLLQAVQQALADADAGHSDGEDPTRTGVYVGVALDANTTNFHLRWAVAAHTPADADAAGPPLTADRTMGALASVAASRVARLLRLGGPCFALSSEDTSGVSALSVALAALRRGDIDRAIVAAVDLPGDPRAARPGVAMGDGAVALVLRRVGDARRVFALVDDGKAAVGTPAVPAKSPVGHLGAASALLDVARGALSVYHQIRTGEHSPAYWLADDADGPRRLSVNVPPSETACAAQVTLSEHVPTRYEDYPDRRQPLGPPAARLCVVSGTTPDEILRRLANVKGWGWHGSTADPLRLACVAESADELSEQLCFGASLVRDPETAVPVAMRDRVFYTPTPLGPGAKVAFVYPGSGNHFADMGRALGASFPEILRRQQRENRRLRSQYAPDELWGGRVSPTVSPRTLIFSQVSVGTLVSDLLRRAGIEPAAVIGNSLGESAGLFGTRAWVDRDAMLERLEASSLFVSDLAGRYDAARRYWNAPEGEAFVWKVGLVRLDAEHVRAALEPNARAFLLIVSAPGECVVGGTPEAVDALAARLGARLFPVEGTTLAHCAATTPVAGPYRELHRLPTTPVPGATYYRADTVSGYVPDTESAASAILGAVQHTIDYPALIERAYADGARVFLEPGPGSSCTRAIGQILAGQPHLARAVCVPRQDNVALFARTLASLVAEGVPVDVSILEADERCESVARTPVRVETELPMRALAYRDNQPAAQATATTAPSDPVPSHPSLTLGASNGSAASTIPGHVAAQLAVMDAHAAYLRFSERAFGHLSALFARQTALLTAGAVVEEAPQDNGGPREIPRSLGTDQCFEFARGRVGDVLGERFAAIDAFPTRVRLPDGPLMLVDRILSIEGEPLSLTHGRVVTEHTVHAERWYLDAGRIPTCVAVESGQADLFLSGFLGIDLRTRGLAVYRLLDAVVQFHGPLPGVGDVIRYDIYIDSFFRQGETHLFRFHFEATVGGRPLMSMREGCAGFFSEQELAAGKGIVHTAFDKRPIPGIRPADWKSLAPFDRIESLTAERVDALRAGDLAGAFGPAFGRLALERPMRLPGGMLRLVHRVVEMDPTGGRYGIGRIRAEADIAPDDWFLTCHFVDDQVMPGTLMYECCMHTLRVLLTRLGWVAPEGTATEPVPGVASRLKCRGQVTAATRVVTYEVSIRELGYGPEPFAVADALMYADGKPVVEITNMSLRYADVTREAVEGLWASSSGSLAPGFAGERVRVRGSLNGSPDPLTLTLSPEAGARGPEKRRPLYDTDRITAFAVGNPSDAFGDRYRVFDRERVIARLPGPPYQFLDRIIEVTGEPWKMVGGPTCAAEYDVPADAWYFEENRCPIMPFSVLLEVALQPCGWLAAYVGSALSSPVDMSFRNLGGKAVQHAAVGPDAGTLTTRVKLTRVSASGGMVIQNYDYRVTAGDTLVYEGDTYFGFFSKDALANQLGLQNLRPEAPTPEEQAAWTPAPIGRGWPFPGDMLRMVDTIDLVSDAGGSHKLGLIQGSIGVDPGAWFFKAHFHQDPVWPGSLGLESMLQLMKALAQRRWGTPASGWQAVALGRKHEWTYRGQVIPAHGRVTVQAVVTAIDDAARVLTCDGMLCVDGRTIYAMKDFTLQPARTDDR